MYYSIPEDSSNSSFVKEQVGKYNNMPFEVEFARRTLLNLKFIDNAVEARHKQGLTDNEINDVFEVTQLINSFVGLLIIPSEGHGPILNTHQFYSNEAKAITKSLENDKNRYHSSYCYFSKWDNKYHQETLSPRSLSRHFRNAVAHDHLKMQPEYLSESESITGFVFEDNYQNSDFYIKLSIDEIRILLSDLCQILIKDYQ